MKNVQDAAAFLFVMATAILTAVCVLGVWDFFSDDVIVKSFQTVGLLAIISAVVIIAGKFMDGASGQTQAAPNPAFAGVRQLTLMILIGAVSLLALLGVLAIWDVIADKATLYKSVGSVAILGFGAFVIVLTCMQRERNPLLQKRSISGGGIVLAFVLLYLIFAFGGLL